MSTSGHIQQLNAVRLHALESPDTYDGLLRQIVPLLQTSAPLDLRRWTADFISETFANQALHPDKKQPLAIAILPHLQQSLEAEAQDAAVIKSLVQAATCIYPLIFRHTIHNASDSTSWQHMTAVKSVILRKMDDASIGIKICCVKFVQRVVQVQTPGVIVDPRRIDHNELSLALVPREHPLLLPANLEAEAQGLLDRLLNVFQDEQAHAKPEDALLITATLNSIGSLVRSRASVSGRILNAILNFDPRRWNQLDTPAANVTAKSVERTLKAFLKNTGSRPNFQGTAFGGRIQGYLDRLSQPIEEAKRKRPAPVEPTDGLDQAKRQRLGADPEQQPTPPLPPGPLSLAQVFALGSDPATQGFHVGSVPFDYVPSIVTGLLKIIDQGKLNDAINAVRKRLLDLSTRGNGVSETSRPQDAEAAGQYPPLPQPDAAATEDLLNQMQAGPAAEEPAIDESIAPFQLPQPPPLSPDEVAEFGQELVHRMMTMIETASDERRSVDHEGGFPRIAGNTSDRDYWTMMLIRQCTRPFAGIVADDAPVVQGDLRQGPPATPIQEEARRCLFQWIMGDWRNRLNTAVAWLNEEWMHDQLQKRAHIYSQNYDPLASQILSSICAYIDASERKHLIRYLSEVPALSDEDLERVKRLAEDPERILMVLQAFLYLAMYRPPVREKALDMMEDLYLHYPEAKKQAGQMLKKHRPEVVKRVEDAETAAAEDQAGRESQTQARTPKAEENGVDGHAPIKMEKDEERLPDVATPEAAAAVTA